MIAVSFNKRVYNDYLSDKKIPRFSYGDDSCTLTAYFLTIKKIYFVKMGFRYPLDLRFIFCQFKHLRLSGEGYNTSGKIELSFHFFIT